MSSDAQRKANAKYLSGHDDIKIRVPKGQRERYKKHAATQGKSLNVLVIELLERDIKERGEE